MKVIQTIATITEHGKLLVPNRMPLPAGNYTVVIVIDEKQVTASDIGMLPFPAHDVGLIDESCTFRREDLYDVGLTQGPARPPGRGQERF